MFRRAPKRVIDHPLPDGRKMWLELLDVKDGRGRVIGTIVANGGFDDDDGKVIDEIYLDEILTQHPPQLDAPAASG